MTRRSATASGRVSTATAAGITRGAGETTRVIVRAAEGQDGTSAAAALRGAGARVSAELDSLGLVVADVPVEKLAELAAPRALAAAFADLPRVAARFLAARLRRSAD